MTGALALWVAADAGSLWRLSRWRGFVARRDALALVLHVGFFFAAAGFLAVDAGALWPSRIPYAAGVHAWAVGAIGVMTLAMMTRATLGHSGRPLQASRGTEFAYLCVVAALVLRLAMAFLPDFAPRLMDAAAAAWILAFAAFLIVYAPTPVRPAGRA